MNFERFQYLNNEEEAPDSKVEELAEEGLSEFRKTYVESDLLNLLESQEDGVPKRALFSDIDNTYYRSDRIETSKKLTEEMAKENIPTIAITGGDFKDVLARITKGELPAFSVISGSVGTEIWLKQAGEKDKVEYQKDVFYEKLLTEKGFDRQNLTQTASALIEKINKKYNKIKFDFQEPEKERLFLTGEAAEQSFKISFFFYGNEQDVENISQELNRAFPNQEIVICQDIRFGEKSSSETVRKYCVDVLPITKASAVRYISDMAGIEQGMIAGDSGNDIQMLLNSERFFSVAVGGQKQELTEAIDNKVFKEKAGRSSWQKVMGDNGEIKSIYIEQDQNRLGPDSILRAATILKRAKNIKKIRERNQE